MRSDFINNQPLSSNALDERIGMIIKEFQFTIPNLFLNSLNSIRAIIGTNMIMSTLSTIVGILFLIE